MEPFFCEWIKKNIPEWQDCIVVSPDEGAVKRAVSVANDLSLDFALIHNRNKVNKLYSTVVPHDAMGASAGTGRIHVSSCIYIPSFVIRFYLNLHRMLIKSELVLNEPPDFGGEVARVGGPGEEGRDDEGVQFPDGIGAPQEMRSRSK